MNVRGDSQYSISRASLSNLLGGRKICWAMASWAIVDSENMIDNKKQLIDIGTKCTALGVLNSFSKNVVSMIIVPELKVVICLYTSNKSLKDSCCAFCSAFNSRSVSDEFTIMIDFKITYCIVARAYCVMRIASNHRAFSISLRLNPFNSPKCVGPIKPSQVLMRRCAV